MTEYYRLVKEEIKPSFINTQALWQCSICRTIIDNVGGPGYKTICVECGDKIISRQFKIEE